MGFAVIQGYGLTETAPIVTLNHPFKTSKGSVGTPIGGVEDPDRRRRRDPRARRERHERVLRADSRDPTARRPTEQPSVDAEGWLHTGDIGERDAQGRLFIKGRKKEMIVTPEGLNVFPEDVERVLERASPACANRPSSASPRVPRSACTRCSCSSPGVDADAVVRAANAHAAGSPAHPRRASVWPGAELPRTEGTRKLKRARFASGSRSGARRRRRGRRATRSKRCSRGSRAAATSSGATTLEELGLSSLERVELMVALEDRFQTRIDEARFSEARSIDELQALVERRRPRKPVDEPVDFPVVEPQLAGARSFGGCRRRRGSCRSRASSRPARRAASSTRGLEGPVVFASNHQSHLDVPVILAALPGRWRARVGAGDGRRSSSRRTSSRPSTTWRERFTNRCNYYLAAFFFNAFPLPQREAGARQTLRYIGELTGDGWSILIFPEGVRSRDRRHQAVPRRHRHDRVAARRSGRAGAHRRRRSRAASDVARWLDPGRVRVTFGAPLRLRGDDYAALAAQVKQAVRICSGSAVTIAALSGVQTRPRKCWHLQAVRAWPQPATVAHSLLRCGRKDELIEQRRSD